MSGEVPQSMDKGSWIVRSDVGSGAALFVLMFVVLAQIVVILRLLAVLPAGG